MTDPAASLAAPQEPLRPRRSGAAGAALRLQRRWARSGAASPWVAAPLRRIALEYGGALAIAALCTAIVYPLYERIGAVNTIMVYLLGTTLGALRLSRGPCVLLPVTNILAFDFFFVPPRFSFDVEDAQTLFTLGVLLLVALVIAHLMVSIRRHRDVTLAREGRTAVLYAMSRELIIATDPGAMAAAAERHISAVFHGAAVILIADPQGQLAPVRPAEEPASHSSLPLAASELACAQEAAARGERCIKDAIYVPLQGRRMVTGVIVVRPRQPASSWPTEQLNLLDAFAAQLAVSLQRAGIAQEAEAARISAERALLRNTLLASISHDLRTPLAAIAGAGGLIAQPDYLITADRRTMLGQLIERKAGDMSQLLSNVLDLAKLEMGSSVLRADWHAIDDLVSHSLRTNQARLAGWRITVELPPELPMILVEATLIVQILSNLLENAAKYTPPGTEIRISAAVHDGTMSLVVADDGPGLPGDPERLFEKFQRGTAESTVVGVGLGLAICRAAARLHGGDIRALSPPGGGARFEIMLPVQMQADGPPGAEADLPGHGT
jgi:two-component system sensor histidine kinase KdpD